MQRRAPKERKPLDEPALAALALRYVERFATTRHKLVVYLQRKLRERPWDGAQPPDSQALADRFADQGYIDDAAFALAKARTLAGRGYGKRRLDQNLRVAGVGDEDAAAARDHAEEAAVAAALRFAEKRRIGPFALAAPADLKARDKALGAMLRAGHNLSLAKAIISLPPGAMVDADELSGRR